MENVIFLLPVTFVLENFTNVICIIKLYTHVGKSPPVLYMSGLSSLYFCKAK